MYYHIQTGAIVSGPHSPQSDYVRKLTRCGTPEVLDLSEYGLVPEIREPLGPQQSHGEPIVSADAVTIPAVDWSAEQIAEAQRAQWAAQAQSRRIRDARKTLAEPASPDNLDAKLAAIQTLQESI